MLFYSDLKEHKGIKKDEGNPLFHHSLLFSFFFLEGGDKENHHLNLETNASLKTEVISNLL